ncbi:hypothetical protein [Campylobacter devanensis]|nr:hypothetical protein [Campylobacter sp. P157]
MYFDIILFLFKGNNMLEFSVKIDPSLEKVAINAIKDVLKKN